MRPSNSVALLLASLAHSILASANVENVLVPGGYRAKANIHAIPARGSLVLVGNEIHVLAANGTIMDKVPSRHDTPARGKPGQLPLTPRTQTGPIAYAYWANAPCAWPISSFATTWEVPPVPETNNGQTLFLYNHIEPNLEAEVLQAVLQYGASAAGGGSFWSVSILYSRGLEVFATPSFPVNPGVTLNGNITLTGPVDPTSATFNYTAQFTNIPGASMDVVDASRLTFATMTLEARNIAVLSDYPSGTTVFSDINLELANGTTPNVKWTPVNDFFDGPGFPTTHIDRDGAADGQITIVY
ncbi:hypothetical protein DFH08DRAFT_1019419 [Mycena albidolilacea]|uniref:Uncharacterized protein n=1 Tax=Mycena albidolilacea TaxID=1033008 RepID=A0AAD7EME9_9AGAR|nr:hypothetical protein DFH08DRAFT_1019419 [Mycena albidolilacea]